MRARGPVLIALLIASGAACADSAEPAPPTTPAAPPTTVAPTDPPPATTIPATTTPATTIPATTIPATTIPATTIPATTIPATTVPSAPVELGEVYLLTETDLVRYDTVSGATVERVEWFTGQGTSRDSLKIAADGRIFYSEIWEDYWYACDTSVGRVGAVDSATWEATDLANGFGFDLAPAGDRVAYVTSETCLPDPAQPDMWVLTPGDRVIVSGLDGTDSIELVTSVPPTGPDDPIAVLGVVFEDADTLLVLTADGSLRRVPIDATDAIDEHPPIGAVAEPGTLAIWLVDAAGGVLTAIVAEWEGVRDVVQIDLATGDRRLVLSAENPIAVTVAPDGTAVIVTEYPMPIAEPEAATMLVVDHYVSSVALVP